MIRYERTSQSANAGARSEGARWVNPTTIHTTILGRVADTSIKAFIVPARFELSRQALLRSGSYNGSNRVRHSAILVKLVRADRFPWNYDSCPKDGFLFRFFNLEGEQTNWEYEFTKLQSWYTGFSFILERRIFWEKWLKIWFCRVLFLIFSFFLFVFVFFLLFVRVFKRSGLFLKVIQGEINEKVMERENFEDMENMVCMKFI